MWAVLVAAIASTAIGALWYSPLVFGKPWMKLMGITPEAVAATPRSSMVWSYVSGLISALVTSFILSKLISWVCNGSTSAALKLAGLVWLGFIAAIMVGSVIWEKKPWSLFFINAAYYLVSLIVMALIITGWN